MTICLHYCGGVEKSVSSSTARRCVSIGSQLCSVATSCRPDNWKVDAIKHIPTPTDRQGVLRLLGMAIYLAKFANSLVRYGPIRALFKDENEFC